MFPTSDTVYPNNEYAKELAQRGYVVLAADYPSFGDYPYDFRKSKYASGSMKGIFNHMRGVDLLQTREEVDPQRIGAIGHSLGGHNALFLGVFDERVKVIVSSGGWGPFRGSQHGNKPDGWDQDVYMPRIRTVYQFDLDRVPFDLQELVAALAPRAFFSSSPVRDEWFSVKGVKRTEPEIREVYSLLGASDAFVVRIRIAIIRSRRRCAGKPTLSWTGFCITGRRGRAVRASPRPRGLPAAGIRSCPEDTSPLHSCLAHTLAIHKAKQAGSEWQRGPRRFTSP